MVRAPQLASVPPGVTVGSTFASTTELSQQEHPAPEPRQPGRARVAQDSPGARVSQQQLCARRGGTHVPWPRSAAALCPASLELLLGTLSFCTCPGTALPADPNATCTSSRELVLLVQVKTTGSVKMPFPSRRCVNPRPARSLEFLEADNEPLKQASSTRALGWLQSDQSPELSTAVPNPPSRERLPWDIPVKRKETNSPQYSFRTDSYLFLKNK